MPPGTREAGARTAATFRVLADVQEEPQPYARFAGLARRTVRLCGRPPPRKQLLDRERGLVVVGGDFSELRK